MGVLGFLAAIVAGIFLFCFCLMAIGFLIGIGITALFK